MGMNEGSLKATAEKIPPIDRKVPGHLETATFAVG